MAKRYQHITSKVRRDIARRLDGLIWEQPAEDDDEDQGDDGALVTV